MIDYILVYIDLLKLKLGIYNSPYQMNKTSQYIWIVKSHKRYINFCKRRGMVI